MAKFRLQVSDYEHFGDCTHERMRLEETFPNMLKNIHCYEERDYEAEADYESEYGELDEYIYQGYIDFEAPDSLEKELRDFGCYKV